MQDILPGLVPFHGLLLLVFMFVAAAIDELAREDTGIGFNHKAIRIARLYMRNCHLRPCQSRCAFEKHQTDGNAVQLLWADRASHIVGFSSVLLVTIGLSFAKGVERFAKSISA